MLASNFFLCMTRNETILQVSVDKQSEKKAVFLIIRRFTLCCEILRRIKTVISTGITIIIDKKIFC